MHSQTPLAMHASSQAQHVASSPHLQAFSFLYGNEGSKHFHLCPWLARREQSPSQWHGAPLPAGCITSPCINACCQLLECNATGKMRKLRVVHPISLGFFGCRCPILWLEAEPDEHITMGQCQRKVEMGALSSSSQGIEV